MNGKKISDSFPCQTVVRQGDNLSPLLFAIYSHDLEQFLQDNYNGLSLLSEIQNQNNLPNEMENYIKLIVLMYVDDTILLAESEEDLQDALSAMFNYCNTWKLRVKVKKTKIVLFSRGKIRKIPNLFSGPKLLNVVDNYTYLSVKITFNGRFVKENSLDTRMDVDQCSPYYVRQERQLYP